jgi:hypothetical protein
MREKWFPGKERECIGEEIEIKERIKNEKNKINIFSSMTKYKQNLPF